MTRYPRYPECKDSGVEWLGEIPAHWETAALKRLSSLITGNTPPKGDSENYENGTTVWVKPDDLMGTEPITDSAEKLSDLGASLARIVPKDSVLVCCIGSIGKIGVAGLPLATNQQINAVTFNKLTKWLPQYGVYALIASESELQRQASSVVVPILNKTGIGAVEYPTPPLPEQRAVAIFLDRQTSNIDAAIDEYRRLIELLGEKRAALISHAVTQGLDPNVPRQESGIPAVGQVPAHWKVRRNKHIFEQVNARSTTGEEELLTVSHITGVTPRSEKQVNMFLAESLEGYKMCQPGDLVINTMWAWMGALGITEYEGIVSPSYHVYRLREAQKEKYIPRYLDFLYRVPAYVCEITRFSKGVWSSRLRLYPDEFFEMYTPLPPVEEQHAIAAYLDRQTANIDAALAEIETAIAHMQEYRSALIAAAVTGQIDVRQASVASEKHKGVASDQCHPVTGGCNEIHPRIP